MKYAIASLLATTRAINIRAEAKGDLGGYCNANYDRIMLQKDETLTGSFVTGNMVDGLFVDPSFPGDRTMLYTDAQDSAGGGGGDGNASQIQAWEQVQNNQLGIHYKRATEVNMNATPWTPNVPKKASEMSLWGEDGISVRISEQGNDGDCWFLSQASSLAGYPERIKALFPGQDKYSEDGVFRVRFFVRGEPVHIIVDDIIPVKGYRSAIGYSVNHPPLMNKPSKAGAWWLVILEKAMAKLNHNYLGINGGQTGESMRYMTGQPTVQYNAASLDPIELWNVVVDGLNNDYNMGAACQVSHFGMISGHAYGVIGAVKLTGGAHDGQMMIKTRNPWGRNVYDGPWSEKATEWTADYRKQAGDYSATDNIGEIWLPIETWSNDYATITVNHWRDDWKISAVEGSDLVYDTLWGDLNSWITIDNPVEQEVLLECIQNDARLFPGNCDSENSPLQFNFQWMDDKVNNMHEIKHQASGGNAGGQCNGDAMYVKKLPAGKTQVRMVNWGGSNAGHDTLFKLKAFATQEEVKMYQQKGNSYII